jgi:hypothetical protein
VWLFGKLSVYSEQLEGLTDDKQHESIEKQGNCIVIARAVNMLWSYDTFGHLSGKEIVHRTTNVDHEGAHFWLFILVLAKIGGTTQSEEANVFLATNIWFTSFRDKHPKFILDNGVILFALSSIRFAQLRATDLGAVSYVKDYFFELEVFH